MVSSYVKQVLCIKRDERDRDLDVG